MMRSITTMLTLAAFTLAGGCAHGPGDTAPGLADPATAAQMRDPAAPPHPAMWVVRDADTTIYLFGTIHALPPGSDWYGGPIAAALDASDTLVTEADVTAMQEQASELVAAAKLPEGQTLRGLLDTEQRARYENAMQALNLPVAAFDRFEPWFAALTLSVMPFQKQGYTGADGAEQVLTGQAGTRQRVELEGLRGQIEIFEGMSPDLQVAFLMESVDTMDDTADRVAELGQAWLDGDTDRIDRLLNDSITDPRLRDVLLTNRNAAWAGWIERRLAQPGAVFMAVGAGHLVGDGSVQQALAGRGIAADRVR